MPPPDYYSNDRQINRNPNVVASIPGYTNIPNLYVEPQCQSYQNGMSITEYERRTVISSLDLHSSFGRNYFRNSWTGDSSIPFSNSTSTNNWSGGANVTRNIPISISTPTYWVRFVWIFLDNKKTVMGFLERKGYS